jgi:hypothetical protein
MSPHRCHVVREPTSEAKRDSSICSPVGGNWQTKVCAAQIKCGVEPNVRRMDQFMPRAILRISQVANVLPKQPQEDIMTRSTMKLVLVRGSRDRGMRTVAGSLLHGYYSAVLADPLPADLKDLVAQLVVLEAGAEKWRRQSIDILQVAPLLPERS